MSEDDGDIIRRIGSEGINVSEESKTKAFEEKLAFANFQEQINLEFKGSYTWEENKYKVVRAVLALSNQQHGGEIFIGIKEENNKGVPVGLTPEVENTYKHDHINVVINEYAEPAVAVRLEQVTSNDKRFLIIKVPEYDYLPIICKKNYQDPATGKQLLQEGTIYHRKKGDNRSYNQWTVSEMREFINLATNKKQARREKNQEIIRKQTRPESNQEIIRKQELSDFLDKEVEGFE